MSFPLEYDGDTVAKFLAIAKYTGLLSYAKGLKIIDLKPRWYRIVFDLVADDGTHHKIDYSVDKPLTRYELREWQTDCINKKKKKSYITAILTEQNR